jgi:hypothetical protein
MSIPDCKHISLTKVDNMNALTYVCDMCGQLYDIDLTACPFRMPIPTFPSIPSKEKDAQPPAEEKS